MRYTDLVRLVAPKNLGEWFAIVKRGGGVYLSRVGCSIVKTAMALGLSVCLVSAGIPLPGGRTVRVREASAEPVPAHNEYHLRDALPATFTPEPPDTVVDDDFFLPEETDRGQLYRDIAVFLVASAFVAIFIIKVFIEEDDEPADDDDNGKVVPPPR